MQKILKISAISVICTVAAISSGCASKTETVETTEYIGHQGAKNPERVTPDLYPAGVEPSAEPVVRESRYRIVSTKPSAEQKDLLAQIINLELDNAAGERTVTVGSALAMTLSGSGYSLCQPSEAMHIDTLYNLPLPTAHYKIGPMTLRNALQILAGPAFSVESDELSRKICFKVRENYSKPIKIN